MLDNIKKKFKMCISSKEEKEIRIFAGLELFCIFASIAAAAWLVIAIIMAKTGHPQCSSMQAALSVFLSAAVGYFTNYIAIEMLFKPYKEDKWHFFSIMTFSYWKQGLIPKNKHKIGVQLGEIVGERLLNPEKMADELCGMVSSFLKGESVIAKIKEYIREGLKNHKERLTAYLAPKIEAELVRILKRELTTERIRSFVMESVMPFITKDATRDMVAKYITNGLQHRVPDLTEMIKTELRKMTVKYLQNNNNLPLFVQPIISPIAPIIAEGLVAFINWDYVQDSIKQKAGGTEFYNMVKEEIFRLGDKFTEWLGSNEADETIKAFIGKIHSKIEAYLDENLAGMLARLADGLVSSEELWSWAEREMLPSVREKVEEIIRLEGKYMVLSNLNLPSRISAEIDKQDVGEFHGMINDLAAQHLGAIQVIGWILGGVIGLLQMFI